MRAWFLLSFALSGCADEACPAGSSRADDGLCHLDDHGTGGDSGGPDSGGPDSGGPDSGGPDSGGPDSGGPDSGDTSGGAELEGFEVGDPITLLGSTLGGGGAEWMDATFLTDEVAMVTGQGGYAIVNAATGEVFQQTQGDRGYKIDSDGNIAVIATRLGRLLILDVSDPMAPTDAGATMAGERQTHEDVAVDGGQDGGESRFLVGYRDLGGVLFDADGTRRGTLEVEDAFAVGLSGDRAVVTTGAELVLFDISDLDAPVELDRAETAGEGRDIAFDGSHLAVALGGNGVDVFSVEADTLTERGHLSLPGSAFGVGLDGDYLWIGAWETVGLAWIGEGGPVMLAHEDPTESAMGIAARGGRALVADWFHTTALQLNPNRYGSEIVIDDKILVASGASDPGLLRIWNGGALPLMVALSADSGLSLSETSVTLSPSASKTVIVTPDVAFDREFEVAWTSDDPDEASGTVLMKPATQTIGVAHEDFSLQGFEWPEGELGTYTLSEQSGRVVFLAYFALY